MSALTKKTYVYPSLLENFFGRDTMNEVLNPASLGSVPAVNIAENENGFRIEVAAPGLSKEDFKLDLNQNKLTISAQKQQKDEQTNEKYTRMEFKYSSFQRTFTLPTSVDFDKVEASYADGVLNIALPKREEAKPKPARQIEIA
ncbi:Hsp20/alpha crystallin family protein [Rhabdobacter roseus]|uniref:HSP20 family protein n=1 Tax=Rhabdobacter roseus TaxID=1655419 RepID=A0A840TQ39_9BACT|nr:Hsp20/alpha crystallin family protein [Rhabdobacter roseus]MBB5282170.1 HSP20 family protein [Rhabdobacter roseus]